MGGFQGQATDIAIHAREIIRIRERLNGILEHHTGQSHDRVSTDTERDYFMTADEAKNYGIVDAVVTDRHVMQKS